MWGVCNSCSEERWQVHESYMKVRTRRRTGSVERSASAEGGQGPGVRTGIARSVSARG